MNDYSIRPLTARLYEWNGNNDGTYRTYDKVNRCYCNKPIPERPNFAEIYWEVYNYACDGYMIVGTSFEKCMEIVEKKFGPIDEDYRDYLRQCPYDAGRRAGLLIEEPDHYE